MELPEVKRNNETRCEEFSKLKEGLSGKDVINLIPEYLTAFGEFLEACAALVAALVALRESRKRKKKEREHIFENDLFEGGRKEEGNQ